MAEQHAGALVGVGILLVAIGLAALVGRLPHPDDEAADAVARGTAALEPDARAAVLDEPGAAGIIGRDGAGASAEDHHDDGDGDLEHEAKEDIHQRHLSLAGLGAVSSAAPSA